MLIIFIVISFYKPYMSKFMVVLILHIFNYSYNTIYIKVFTILTMPTLDILSVSLGWLKFCLVHLSMNMI